MGNNQLHKKIEALKEQVNQLTKQVKQLTEQNDFLTKELEKYKNPPKDSSNSSLPPSTDKKPNKYPDKEKSDRKPGGQYGHKGETKYIVNNPDEVKEILPTECANCGCENIINTGKILERRQEIDLPPITPYVVEYQQIAGKCSQCGKKVVGGFPVNINSPVVYGNKITALIAYLSIFGNNGYNKISKCFEEVFNCPISEGTVYNKLNKVANILNPVYDNILEELRKATVVGSDETSIRICAKNGWNWVFQNEELTYLVSRMTRGFAVIEELFGKKFEGVWVSDRFGAQLKIEGKHQICIAHIIRNCKYVKKAENSEFAGSLLELLYESIEFRRKAGDNYRVNEVQEKIIDIKRRMKDIFGKPPPQKQERTLFQGLLGRQDQLLLFLDNAEVPYDNNGSERSLRSLVTKRKVSNGFRSQEGARFYDIIGSVFQTLQKQGLDIMDSLLDMLNGKNVLLGC